MENQSQTKQIEAHLKAGNKLTAIDALRRFNSLRLSGRIYELKKAGLPVNSRMVKVNGKRIAEYSL